MSNGDCPCSIRDTERNRKEQNRASHIARGSLKKQTCSLFFCSRRPIDRGKSVDQKNTVSCQGLEIIGEWGQSDDKTKKRKWKNQSDMTAALIKPPTRPLFHGKMLKWRYSCRRDFIRCFSRRVTRSWALIRCWRFDKVPLLRNEWKTDFLNFLCPCSIIITYFLSFDVFLLILFPLMNYFCRAFSTSQTYLRNYPIGLRLTVTDQRWLPCSGRRARSYLLL